MITVGRKRGTNSGFDAHCRFRGCWWLQRKNCAKVFVPNCLNDIRDWHFCVLSQNGIPIGSSSRPMISKVIDLNVSDVLHSPVAAEGHHEGVGKRAREVVERTFPIPLAVNI